MTDERHDDEVLGRALSRAIQTQAPNETPYERSRIAARTARRGLGLWPLAGVAATLVVALAFASWFTRPSDSIPVAASPTAITTSPSPVTATPAATPSASPTDIDHDRVYFSRDGLPPVGAHVVIGPRPPDAASRIRIRLTDLLSQTVPPPSGAFTAVPPASVFRDIGDISVTVAGDVSVDFVLRGQDWGIQTARLASAFVQQLVYTATEEPGIRRALITQNGGKTARIDQLVLEKPLSREDVFGYAAVASRKTALGYGDTKADPRTFRTRTSVDAVAPGLARVVIEVDPQYAGPTGGVPDFKVEVFENDETNKPLGGKWRLVVTVNGTDTTTGALIIDQTPLRSLVAGTPKCVGCVGTFYEIGLDDLRPWRTAIAFDPFRIIIDIGGDPRMIFGNNAVYAPAYGATVARTFQLSGIAHNFEAHVDIRVLDDRQKEILRTFTTATNCCDPGGTFDATIQLPAGVTGTVSLEVFEGSAKDGSDTKVIRIPLTVR